ncbi:hypothetical protein [Variovorax defluvii]|uniref:hypothetical protein n=1 Tax=Variovorax defluvii TaxID=913761 RepID=UPI0031EE11DA
MQSFGRRPLNSLPKQSCRSTASTGHNQSRNGQSTRRIESVPSGRVAATAYLWHLLENLHEIAQGSRTSGLQPRQELPIAHVAQPFKKGFVNTGPHNPLDEFASLIVPMMNFEPNALQPLELVVLPDLSSIVDAPTVPHG